MSAVLDFVEDTLDFVGDVIEDVGDVISDVVEVAFDIVEDVGDFVGDAVEAALDDPVGTIAKVAAVATGNAWALPYISAGSVIVNGGSLEDAIIAGGTTYIAQGVVDYINAPVPGDFDYGPSIPNIVPEVDLSPVASVIPEVIPEVLPDVSEITNWTPTYGEPTVVAGGAADTITDAGPVQPGITTGGDAPYRVDVSGAAGTAESPQYVTDPDQLTPGSVLATLDQIDAGTATWNPAANAWETASPASGSLDAGPGAYPYTPGNTTGAVNPGDVDYGPVGTGPVTPVETPYNPYTDQGPSQPGVVTPGTGGPPVDTVTDLGTIPVTDTRLVAPPVDTVTDLGTIPIIGTRPYTPPPLDNTVVNVDVTPPDVFTPTPVDSTVVPVDVTPPVDVTTPPIDLTPYIPILVPPITSTPDTPTPYTPPPYVAPTFTRSGGQGLNPGLMAPTPFYQTYNPAQSQFSWGPHGYQTGTAFNAQAYNQAPASATPYGLQQLGVPLTAEQIADILAGRASAPGPIAPMATRTQDYNPASMITPNATNVYQLPVIKQIKG